MQPQGTRLSVCQAVEGFLFARQAEGKSPRTIEDYRYCLRLYLTWLEKAGRHDMLLASVTTDGLRAFFVSLQERERPFSPKTRYNVHVSLRAFFGWANSEFHVSSPMQGIKAPKVSPPAVKLPTREELERALVACERSNEARTKGRRGFRMKRPTALRDKALVLLLADTGLRASEATALRISDADLADGSVIVRHGKGDRERICYMGKSTRKALWRYLASRPGAGADEPLFMTASGRSLTRMQLTHLLERIGQRIGIRLYPHLLRHLAATLLLKNGASTLAVRQMIGHVSDEMLRRYVQLAEVDLKEAHASASPADRWRL
jgi:integrase/recombinase XerD